MQKLAIQKYFAEILLGWQSFAQSHARYTLEIIYNLYLELSKPSATIFEVNFIKVFPTLNIYVVVKFSLLITC